MVFQDNNEDVVVFFDFENIVYSLRNKLGENPNFEVLMDKCQEYGRIVLARAYADWSRHNTVIAPLQASGFDPVYVPTYFYESKEQKARKMRLIFTLPSRLLKSCLRSRISIPLFCSPVIKILSRWPTHSAAMARL